MKSLTAAMLAAILLVAACDNDQVEPTLPVAALLEKFKQPIFGGSVDDGSFDIVGYVDQDRASCKSVQADPEAYSTLERKIAFQSEYGFYPVQCIPQSGILEHREAFIRAYIRKATQ